MYLLNELFWLDNKTFPRLQSKARCECKYYIYYDSRSLFKYGGKLQLPFTIPCQSYIYIHLFCLTKDIQLQLLLLLPNNVSKKKNNHNCNLNFAKVGNSQFEIDEQIVSEFWITPIKLLRNSSDPRVPSNLFGLLRLDWKKLIYYLIYLNKRELCPM